MSYVKSYGQQLSTDVTVEPGASIPGRRSKVLPAIAQHNGNLHFDLDAPVYEGDWLEWGRGDAVIRAVATRVREHDRGRIARGSFLEVEYSTSADQTMQGIPSSNGGHVIVVNGSNVNIAFDGSTITQQIPVASGYEELADAVGRALALIEQAADVDPDEVDVARDAATLIVEETAKPTPDEKVIKRLLPSIRGVLTAAANSGAGAAATALVTQLFLGA